MSQRRVSRSARGLQKSLDRGEFTPFFQPIVALRSGKLHGYEILARWCHPESGLLLPSDFIPALEESGLGFQLTEHLLIRALSAVRQPEVRLSVNISPRQLKDRLLPQMIERVAGEAGCPFQRLTVEITEDALLDCCAETIAVADGLKQLGIRLALDDFGTGYSSLSHLQALPLDEIKVDQSFVRHMTTRRNSRKIVAAVVGLGRSLGFSTVAEGVEHREQADMLLCLGCEFVQGWYFGKPAPAEEIITGSVELLRPLQATFEKETGLTQPSICLDALPTERYGQLRAIYDGAPVGLCFVDRELRYVSLNQRLAEMHGLSVQAHLGKRVEELEPIIYAQVKSHLREALSGTSIEGVELNGPFLQRPGGDLTLLASFVPARDEADEIQGVLVAVVDISERKRQEKELRDSEARLQAVIDAVPIGIAIAEAPSGRVTSRNPAARKILHQDPLGFERVADYSERVNYFYKGVRLKAEEFPMVRALQQGVSTELEPVFCDLGEKQGKWLKLSGTPVRDTKQDITGAVVVIQEIAATDSAGDLSRIALVKPGASLNGIHIAGRRCR